MPYVYDLNQEHGLELADLKALIGSKAANLAVMASELALPVPPAFAVSTKACNAYLAGGWPDGLDAEIADHMHRLESTLGRGFGDPAHPLLVSVRSGAPVSMPGMMDTILNLGLNNATEAGLATVAGNPAFAADCHRRFREMFTGIVGSGTVPADPWEQLHAAVLAVFRSWNGDRARAYRAHEGIPDDLGTGVTVEAMVFGNWGDNSGTGVLFTRNPATGERGIYGDVLFASQGEDVVAGTHRTQSLAALDERLPEVGRELRDYADRLEHHFADLCDIEFTIERGKLWMLQVRVGKRSPQAALRIAVDMAEDPGFPLTRAEAVQRVARYLVHPPVASVGHADADALTTGLPASPGVASGEIATTPEAALAVATAGRPVILVRSETSPDDVGGMARAAGVLTARGGLASHAAVVARGWGIPAVVGAEQVQVGDGTVVIAGHSLHSGDTITIDGGTGEVFAGALHQTSAVVPEAATLLAWARELGIPIGATAPKPGAGEEGEAEVSEDGVIRALAIKGSTLPDLLAPVLLSNPERVGPVVDLLVAAGDVERAGGMLRLSAKGKARGAELLAADQRRWGSENADAALDHFLELDHRMKETVTAWQLRDVDGTQALNDHTDHDYDRGVLDRLGALHGDAVAWLESLTSAPEQLDAYRVRLDRAIEHARGGDDRFVASPRVDSYHSVWFELHEDLIRLAGRDRAAETAAGRA